MTYLLVVITVAILLLIFCIFESYKQLIEKERQKSLAEYFGNDIEDCKVEINPRNSDIIVKFIFKDGRTETIKKETKRD